MHSTSSKPIILHGKGSRPFLVSKLFWLISVLKLQVCNLLCLDFPGKCLRRPENWSCLSLFFFLLALEWWIFHKCIIIITFSKLFAAFLITEQLLIKGNYQTALPHSNNLVFALLFCLVSQPSLFLYTEKGTKKRTFCTTILFLILWEEVEKGTSPFSHL